MTPSSSHHPDRPLSSLASRFEALRPRLKAWASRMLGNDSDADDALQEAFFRLWRRPEAVPGSDSGIDAVSVTAVRSACVDAIRRRNVRRAESLDDDEARAAGLPDTSTDEAMRRSELLDEVNDLMARTLDERARRILTLHDSLGYDYSEIAEQTGVTEANARVIISRARKAIREAYRSRHNH